MDDIRHRQLMARSPKIPSKGGSTAPPQSEKFWIGEIVEKVSGYAFPGTVIGVAMTKAGLVRYVVEHSQSPGLLHIFAPEQLRSGE